MPGVAGPMANSLPTLETFMSGFLAGQPWLFDPVVMPMPWRHEIAAKPTRKLRIGYYLDDGVVRVQPPHEAAVKKALAALDKAGHEGELRVLMNAAYYLLISAVFKWDTSTHGYGYKLWERAVLADGGKRCQLLCEKENEPLIEGVLVGTEKDRLDVDQSNAVSAINFRATQLAC